MNGENRRRFLQKFQEVIERERISAEDLLQKVKLGIFVLWFWKDAGKRKEPEEVLHLASPGVIELLKEIQ